MARTLQLTPAQTESVKEALQPQLGAFLAGVAKLKDGDLVALRESFVLYIAAVPDLISAAESGRPLLEACRRTETWHHQIALGTEVAASARTKFTADSQQGRFQALIKGSLSRDLDAAIRLADEKYSDSHTAWLVRIFGVPVYFLLLGDGKTESVLIVSSFYARRGLGPLQILEPAEFGRRLRGLPKVVGIRLDADEP
jgi:hypothetical protein